MTPVQKDIFFNVFTWVLILCDTTFWSCKSTYGKILNIIHQYVCSLILFLGPLYGHYFANVLIMTLTLLGWLITGTCPLTAKTNYECKDRDGTPFRNLPYHCKMFTIPIFGKKDDYSWWSWRIDYTLLTLLLLYNLYMSKIIKL